MSPYEQEQEHKQNHKQEGTPTNLRTIGFCLAPDGGKS